MTPLTDDENRKHEKSNDFHICNEKYIYEKENEKYHEWKKRDHFHYTGKYRGAAHSTCNLKYQIPNEIPVVFHNGSEHDFHFIINELVKGIDGIRCFGEDKEKYITFKVPMKKENKNGKLITIKLKFMTALDLWTYRYQVLYTIYRRSINKNVFNVKKERMNQENVNMLDM